MINELQQSKYNNDSQIVGLLVDLRQSVQDVQPVVYKSYGSKKMKMRTRCHMEQRSGAEMYMNSRQANFKAYNKVWKAQKRKGGKKKKKK